MEKKSSISKNLLVIVIVVVLIAVVAVVASLQQRQINPTLGTLEADATATPEVTAVPEATATPEVTAVPEATAAPEETEEAASTEAAEATAAPETTLEPAKAYLVVTVAGAMYEPIPLYQEGRYTIRRGEDLVNVIEVTTDSIKMHESSCDNQDCVEQGVVSLENRAGRVLQNMIICLPNEVVLELYTPEEVAQLLLSMVGYTGEETAEDAGNE